MKKYTAHWTHTFVTSGYISIGRFPLPWLSATGTADSNSTDTTPGPCRTLAITLRTVRKCTMHTEGRRRGLALGGSPPCRLRAQLRSAGCRFGRERAALTGKRLCGNKSKWVPKLEMRGRSSVCGKCSLPRVTHATKSVCTMPSPTGADPRGFREEAPGRPVLHDALAVEERVEGCDGLA